MSPQVQSWVILIGAATILVLVPWMVIRSSRRGIVKIRSEASEIAAAARATAKPADQIVEIEFHFYRGMLHHVDQVRVCEQIPASAAPWVLRKYFWINILNLGLYPGALFVPLLSAHEWWIWSRRVRRLQSQAASDAPGEPLPPTLEESSKRALIPRDHRP